MLTNNDNCGTPQQNLQYDSVSCYYSNGRDLKNLNNLTTTGYQIFAGKLNDLAWLRTLNNADGSITISMDALNKIIQFAVAISADPGNTITVQPDGLYSAGGGASADTLNPLLLMGG
jgi:hypothetical protein